MHIERPCPRCGNPACAWSRVVAGTPVPASERATVPAPASRDARAEEAIPEIAREAAVATGATHAERDALRKAVKL